MWEQRPHSLQSNHSTTDISLSISLSLTLPQGSLLKPNNFCGRNILLLSFDSNGIEQFAQSHGENEGNSAMGATLLLEVQLNPERHNCPPAHPSER